MLLVKLIELDDAVCQTPVYLQKLVSDLEDIVLVFLVIFWLLLTLATTFLCSHNPEFLLRVIASHIFVSEMFPGYAMRFKFLNIFLKGMYDIMYLSWRSCCFSYIARWRYRPHWLAERTLACYRAFIFYHLIWFITYLRIIIDYLRRPSYELYGWWGLSKKNGGRLMMGGDSDEN